MIMTFIFGIFVGLIQGLTGAGGGILAVPALLSSLHWSIQQATPVALVAVAGSAALGAISAIKTRQVRYKAALCMALIGIPFTTLGVSIAHYLPQQWLLLLFAAVVLFSALRTWQKSQQTTQQSHHALSLAPAKINPENGRFLWTRNSVLVFCGIGSCAGLMTGLLGVGGGFIIVPLLRKYTDASMRAIVATSLMVIALVGSGGIFSAVAHGAELPLDITSLFAGAAFIGMLLARRLITVISELWMQRALALLLTGVALSLIMRAISHF